MSCPEPAQMDAAPPSPVRPPPTQDESNGGAAHAESDAEKMETESEGDGEKEFDKSTGTKRKHTYGAFREYREVGRWSTGPDSLRDNAEIDHHIKMLMKKFMQDSRLMIAPGKDQEKNKTDIALWKQQRKPYWNSTTSALASPSKIVTRVSIIGNCKAIVMACTGPAAGPRFKEIKKYLHSYLKM